MSFYSLGQRIDIHQFSETLVAQVFLGDSYINAVGAYAHYDVRR